MQPITLRFHGKAVRLITLVEQMKTLPIISVPFSELAKENRFADRGRPIEDSDEEISVYKQDGTYIVLTGKTKLEAAYQGPDTFFPARLVSKHALKHLQSMGDNLQAKAATPRGGQANDSQRLRA